MQNHHQLKNKNQKKYVNVNSRISIIAKGHSTTSYDLRGLNIVLVCILCWTKPDLWGLGGESCCIVASLHYAKMIPQCEDHFGIVKASYDAP